MNMVDYTSAYNASNFFVQNQFCSVPLSDYRKRCCFQTNVALTKKFYTTQKVYRALYTSTEILKIYKK